MVEKLNLFLDLLQSYRVSLAAPWQARSFRGSCDLTGCGARATALCSVPVSSPLGGRCAVLWAVALPTQIVSRGVLVCGASSHRDPLRVRAWARCSRCCATSTSERAASRAACEWVFRRSLSQHRPCLP